MASKSFKKGKKYALEYLNSLVESKKANFLGEKDEEHCERHETYIHRWNYKLNEGDANVQIGVGPLKYATDYKKFEEFSLTIDSIDNNTSEKLMNDLEKIMKKEEKADKRVRFWGTAAAIAATLYATTLVIDYAPKAYNYLKDECCKAFNSVENFYINGFK